MNSQETSMLYYFLDAIFGGPQDFEVLFKMAKELSAERYLSDDYNEALQYVADLARDALSQGKISVRGFYVHIAAQVREPYLSLPTTAQCEAHECLRRATQ